MDEVHPQADSPAKSGEKIMTIDEALTTLTRGMLERIERGDRTVAEVLGSVWIGILDKVNLSMMKDTRGIRAGDIYGALGLVLYHVFEQMLRITGRGEGGRSDERKGASHEDEIDRKA